LLPRASETVSSFSFPVETHSLFHLEMKSAAEQLGEGGGTSVFLLRNKKKVIKLLQSPCEGLRRCVTGVCSQLATTLRRKGNCGQWWDSWFARLETPET